MRSFLLNCTRRRAKAELLYQPLKLQAFALKPVRRWELSSYSESSIDAAIGQHCLSRDIRGAF